MDVCGEIRWADGHCHPNRVLGGCCMLLLNKPQSDYCSNQVIITMCKFQVQSFTSLVVVNYNI